MLKATLRLFNAVQVGERSPAEIPQSILERTIRHGYILDPAIRPDAGLLDTIESVVGISGKKANAAFHKSWSVVRDASMEALVIQQIIHYFTTYGFEALGIYRQDAVYIPRETLELPAVQNDIPLVVIKALDAHEILDCVVNLGSGIALAQKTLDDIMTIVRANAYDPAFIRDIGNRELKALLNDLYAIVPSEPVAFLRYLVSSLTGESLLIKNDYLIEKIENADGNALDRLLADAPDDLASIFFRFKPLFLALKSISGNKTFFNRLRKQADTLHKPMPEDYLNSVTARARQGRLDLDTLARRVQKASTWRKIRLASALNYRLYCGHSIVYRVRNGRGWATGFAWPGSLADLTRQALDIVLAAIVDDIRANVDGKMIYIPPNVHYALPASEKQFTGYLPAGSYVSVPQDMIVGIHWTNTERRVDLDLSVIDESGKFGWDAAYRSQDKSVLFSGDMTDAPAPDGASELFYLKGGTQPRILMVNYYNFSKGAQVEGRILVAHERPGHFDKNYVVDPNKIVASANIPIARKQNILGLITSVDGENRFYFAHVSIGSSITARRGDQATHARKYLVSRFLDPLDFNQVLTAAGAHVVSARPDGDHLDLSPEALDKTTIIDLIGPTGQ